ncbi:MAG: hypothetical protein R3C05_14505 [Pirellulaceae bacterium]
MQNKLGKDNYDTIVFGIYFLVLGGLQYYFAIGYLCRVRDEAIVFDRDDENNRD